MGELRDDPEFRAWADDRKAKVISALNDSAVCMSILSPPFTFERLDVQQALEIGATLLLGKPLILTVAAGCPVPDGLAKAAAAIVEFDEPIESPSNIARLKAAIDQAVPRG